MEVSGTSSKRACSYAFYAQLLLNPVHVLEGLGIEVGASEVYDCLVTPCSSRYIPLSESSIVGARRSGNGWSFGMRSGDRSRDVERFYRQTGFDYRVLPGDPRITETLRPDSLAVELAFMAYLCAAGDKGAGAPETEQAAPGNRPVETAEAEGGRGAKALARAFLARHLAAWVGKAAAICDARSDRWLAEAIAACLELVETDMQGLD